MMRLGACGLVLLSCLSMALLVGCPQQSAGPKGTGTTSGTGGGPTLGQQGSGLGGGVEVPMTDNLAGQEEMPAEDAKPAGESKPADATEAEKKPAEESKPAENKSDEKKEESQEEKKDSSEQPPADSSNNEKNEKSESGN
ncbi:MAG: hypothetical protein KatS3mg114_0742 [Planctomycetaceae bacterium]|nr:MAG: hypothetical protein KatS3mg114_0742 [Planctomycetaceae bacterium]